MVNDELNWQKILEIGASSLGSSIGAAIISEMFPSEDSATEAVGRAVEEICNRIQKIIDQAFLDDYVDRCNSIARRLQGYPESQDENILHSIYDDGSDLVDHLTRFDKFEGITALVYICTLHLTDIKALSDIIPGYKTTLSRCGKEYADLCEPRSDRLVDFTNGSVGEAMFGNSGNYDVITAPTTSNSYPTLKYRFYFVDEWDENLDTRAHIYDSDPILLTDSLWYTESPGTPRYKLTEAGRNAPSIQRIYADAISDIQSQRDNFLNVRLDVANSMRENIRTACDEWRKL
ncbi:hypothetical protein COJ83_18340 [Bacillus cereus]|uniref:hypothetical protein n=1 Tax=Bacillus cereus TaxID=1396 RepID=UPI000BF887E2|nr:hypothetical protein [Bacillus cereus]PFO65949.1 hypothetical protein COJ83_18340 [Bacillus cereus]